MTSVTGVKRCRPESQAGRHFALAEQSLSDSAAHGESARERESFNNRCVCVCADSIGAMHWIAPVPSRTRHRRCTGRCSLGKDAQARPEAEAPGWRAFGRSWHAVVARHVGLFPLRLPLRGECGLDAREATEKARGWPRGGPRRGSGCCVWREGCWCCVPGLS